MTIRVAVVDEHEIFRRGVVACLADDLTITVVAEVADEVPCEPADVIVASAPATSTLEFECPMVVCTNTPLVRPSSHNQDRVMAILPRGGLTRDRLIAAVRGAAVGLEMNLASSVQATSLDDRRLNILRLLADGADTREISQHLHYSQRTIKGLISSIETELDSRNRTHAVATAIRHGLI